MVNPIQGMDPMMGSGMRFKMESLTEEQQNKIQTILSQYDPENISTEDAKAIFQSFSEAGIKPARGMKEAIEAAGFDADDLRAKVIPEGGLSNIPKNSNNSRINLSALQSLQDTLSQFDLTNLSEDDATSLLSILQEQGFMNSGSMIDLKS
jgi:hypothetical protein